MKKLIFYLLFISFVVPAVRLHAQNVTFNVSSPPAVVVGTQFQIQYIVNVQNCRDFRLPEGFSEVFNVLFEASAGSTSIQINNGQRSTVQSMTYTLTLMAKNEGTFTIDPATVQIGNSEYKSNTFTINVLPQDKAAAQAQQGGGAQQQNRGGSTSPPAGTIDQDVFMRMEVAKRSVYEQEGLLVTFKLYTLLNIGNITPKYPEFEGFLAPEIELKDYPWVQEHYNGRNYQSVIIKQNMLYPQRTGQLQIGSGKIDLTARIVSQSTRGRSFFGDFFNTYQDIPVTIESQPATIEVKPLPSGKPASFSNAVGNFTMTSEINKSELKANEAVTIKVTIRGNGNLRVLKRPEVKFPNDFEIYDPKDDNSNIRLTTAGTNGTKTIEYMAIPRFAGDFEIPPIVFSYFDPQSGTYKTQQTEPYKLHVAKDENSADGGPVISNFTNRESVRFLGKDIRYLKTQEINFQSATDMFFGSFLYVMAYLMLTILFVVFFIIYRKQVRENSNLALVRTKKANKTAVKRLKNAEKLLRDKNEEAFYEEVLHALWGYMSDKLSIPQSSLTKDNIAAELAKIGVDESLSDEFLNIIHSCEFARYTPNKTEGAMDKLFGETIDAINKMENTIKK